MRFLQRFTLFLVWAIVGGTIVASLSGCGGGGGDANERAPRLVRVDEQGREFYDTNENGKADIMCGGRGGDAVVTGNAGGNITATGGAGGGCVSIAEGDENDGNNTGDDQDNSSEETHEAPADG